MQKYLGILMVCLFCCVKCFESNNHSTSAPITRIIKNYEKHLQKLKDKYENLHGKRSRLKERSADSSAEAKDNVIDDWTQIGEDDTTPPNSIPIALSPFELPVQEIGMLPEPSTIAPIFPHRHRIKYFMKYAKRRVTKTPQKALISGDTIKGMEKPINEEDNSNESSEISTRVDGDSRRVRLEKEFANIRRVKHIAESDNLQVEPRRSVSKSKGSFDSSSEMKRRKSGRLDQLNAERRQKQQTYPIVNLFKATMSNEKYRKQAEKITEPSFGDNLTNLGIPKEKPMQENLPIRRLEDAKPVVDKENDLSSDEDPNDLPFLMRPDLFNILSTTQIPYTFAKTTIRPTTQSPQTTSEAINWQPIDFLMEESAFITESPSLTTESIEVETSTADKSVEVSNTIHPTRNYLPTEQTRASTIVDSMEVSELEPADLDIPIDFEKLYRQGVRRRQKSMEFYIPDKQDYEEDDEDFPYYVRKKYHNQQHRFGFRRKPMQQSFYEDDDSDFYPLPGRSNLRFPSRVNRPQALSLPVAAASVEDQEVQRIEHEAIGPTLRPKSRYSTLRTGIAGERRNTPPVDPLPRQIAINQAPSPEAQSQDRKSIPPPTPQMSSQTKAELQMSAENCKKVQNYSVLFGVPDPQNWVRKNCGFVKTFVNAPCDDINTFVDSCYRFKQHRR